MSEKLKTGHESHEIHQSGRSGEVIRSATEKSESPHKRSKSPEKAISEARAEIEQVERSETHNKALEHLRDAEKPSKPTVSSYVNRELKALTLKRELTHVRRRLSLPARGFSKIIHQPVIRAVSEPLGKTAGRPSGLLGGGLTAFAGGTAYLYLTEHTGMTYSYAVFAVLFTGGFALGLVLELLVHMATGSRRHAND